jgi:hypothetical protein
VVEIKPQALVNTRINRIKFDAARGVHGEKFIVLTEDDVHRPDASMIQQLIEDGRLTFHPSTDKKWFKFKEQMYKPAKGS